MSKLGSYSKKLLPIWYMKKLPVLPMGDGSGHDPQQEVFGKSTIPRSKGKMAKGHSLHRKN